MPLDTARVTDELSVLLGTAPAGQDSDGVADTYSPGLDAGLNIGAALRAAREFHGLDLEELSQATRIRRSYLTALEDMRFEDLPSRPFIIGYIRAYAKALRLDPEAAVARFREDAPDEGQGLRAPVGVRRERDPRLTLFVVAGIVVVIGVALWNVAQHSITVDAPPVGVPPTVAQSAAQSAALPVAAPPAGAVALGAPLPAPSESTTPAPYVTPGMSSSGSAIPTPSAAQAATIVDPAAAPTPFVAKGAIYGAPPASSSVTLQATRPGSLVIHGPDGQVYFAKELAIGEAYRLPQIAGLSVSVSDPAAFSYYVGGMLKGVLPAAQTPIAKLAE